MRPSKLFHAIVIVGAAMTGGCGASSDTDAGEPIADAGEAIADAAMDAATDPEDAGVDAGEDAMVLIL